MHGDVVEIAEPILHALKRGKKLLAPFQCPLGREQRGEELRRITQLLGLDAELVTAACIEPRQPSAFLANLAPAPRQLLEREYLDRQIAAVADKVVLRLPPQAGLEPCRHVEGEGAKARRVHRRLRA